MSKIEWTGKTWNPIVGCSIVSPGCTNCYAMRMAARLEAMGGDGLDDNGYGLPGTGPLDHYRELTKRSKDGPVWTGKLALAPEHIFTAPLRRRTPTTWLVNSMGDLFHEDVPDEWIDRVFAVMALTPQHTYQVLTKRAARMRAYMLDRRPPETVSGPVMDIIAQARKLRPEHLYCMTDWPLPNVWLGVSAERQSEADARIPDLLATPAAVRFVSAEPLLGPMDFTRIDVPDYGYLNALADGYFADGRPPRRRLDWVIVGGESGTGARPMHPDWARSIRDQCVAAGVPFFFKQWGVYGPCEIEPPGAAALSVVLGSGKHLCGEAALSHVDDDSAEIIGKFGKARAGRHLDGRTWDEMPAQREVTP